MSYDELGEGVEFKSLLVEEGGRLGVHYVIDNASVVMMWSDTSIGPVELELQTLPGGKGAASTEVVRRIPMGHAKKLIYRVRKLEVIDDA